jgi:hypothetical protein
LGVATSFDTIVQEIEKNSATTITIVNQHYYTTIAATPIVKTHQ